MRDDQESSHDEGQEYNTRFPCTHKKEPTDFHRLIYTFLGKTIELCHCDALCVQCYDWWMDLGAKAIAGDYL
jgi:hypothetical protein